jgi:hypothetical protein
MAIRVAHSALSNPSCLTENLPLEPYRDHGCDSEQYKSFARGTMTDILNQARSLTICRVICDNLRAHVAGPHRFLESDDRKWGGILHIPWANHVTNLVFQYVLQMTPVADVVTSLPAVIWVLNSAESYEIPGRRCLSIVRTRSISLLDVFGWIIRHFSTIETALAIAEEPLITYCYPRLHILFFPLSLFSRQMETRSPLLADVIPAASEVLREWSQFHSFFGDEEAVVECLNGLTAYFLARPR